MKTSKQWPTLLSVALALVATIGSTAASAQVADPDGNMIEVGQDA